MCSSSTSFERIFFPITKRKGPQKHANSTRLLTEGKEPFINHLRACSCSWQMGKYPPLVMQDKQNDAGQSKRKQVQVGRFPSQFRLANCVGRSLAMQHLQRGTAGQPHCPGLAKGPGHYQQYLMTLIRHQDKAGTLQVKKNNVLRRTQSSFLTTFPSL